MHIYKGFTLIELMVVIAIIGILSAMVTPFYKDYVIRAKITGAIAMLEYAKKKASECIIEHGTTEPCDDKATGIDTLALDDSEYLWRASVSQGKVAAWVDWIALSGESWLSFTGVTYPPALILEPTLSEGGLDWTCGVERDSLFPYVPDNCRNIMPKW